MSENRNNTYMREHGSYRDPENFVFHYNGEIYRALSDNSFITVKALQEKGVLSELESMGHIVPTEIITPEENEYSELAEYSGTHAAFLRHKKITPLSFPYEWSPSMLADTGIHCLNLQSHLLKKGFSLKDASAYNFQFIKGQPVFIDLGSIEPIKYKSIWPAYGQFCRMFLFPLMLQKYKKIDIKSLFLANINGPDISYTYKLFNPVNMLRPALFIDLFLQKQLGKTTSCDKPVNIKKDENIEIQLLNLKRLCRLSDQLRKYRKRKSEWKEYSKKNPYSSKDADDKQSFIENALSSSDIHSVLDIGCNTGVYSIIAAKAGKRVTAIDADVSCIEILYNKVKEKKVDILPLCVDITNPSPAVGLNNKERNSFINRIAPDCVLALSLIHHLLITQNIPLAEIRDLFASLTLRTLIIELIPENSAEITQLTGFSGNSYPCLKEENFIGIFSEKFRISDKKTLSDSNRVIFVMEKLA